MKKVRRLMAYFYMPLIFVLIGYLLISLAFKPFFDIGFSMVNMVVAEAPPTFDNELQSIFQEKETEIVQGETDPSENVVKEDTIPLSEVVIPEYETHYGKITSDRLNLSADLYFGDSNKVLRYGVGQYIGSSLPGFGGTILVAAHNTMHFLPLKDAEIKDIIQVETNYGTYQYEITDIKILRHDDPSAVDLAQTQKEQLVLYTCYPFEAIVGVKQERFFVYADKISGPNVE